jgi:daunorubicin resistance ABC transporter ATP-binding subunit
MAQGVIKSFGGRRVLDDLDLAVEQGTIFALLGPNGAGKTTLVRILATLTRPDSGTITVNGHDPRTDPVRVRRSISLTGQHAAVDDVLTGRENLVMMARLLHLPRRAAKARAAELLSTFGLEDAAGKRVKEYSGGMRRRLDLAVGVIARPPLLFLDEPTTGLDPRSRNQLWDVVRDLAREGVTVFLTTQYLEEADKLAGAVAVLHHGRIVAQGTPAQLKARPTEGPGAGRTSASQTLDEVFLALTEASREASSEASRGASPGYGPGINREKEGAIR